jgi:hypothetical protein
VWPVRALDSHLDVLIGEQSPPVFVRPLVEYVLAGQCVRMAHILALLIRASTDAYRMPDR